MPAKQKNKDWFSQVVLKGGKYADIAKWIVEAEKNVELAAQKSAGVDKKTMSEEEIVAVEALLKLVDERLAATASELLKEGQRKQNPEEVKLLQTQMNLTADQSQAVRSQIRAQREALKAANTRVTQRTGQAALLNNRRKLIDKLGDKFFSRVQDQIRVAIKNNGGGQKGVKVCFDKYDTDKSGSLELAEFTEFARKELNLGKIRVTDDDLKNLVTALDKDGNLTISLNELLDFAERGTETLYDVLSDDEDDIEKTKKVGNASVSTGTAASAAKLKGNIGFLSKLKGFAKQSADKAAKDQKLEEEKAKTAGTPLTGASNLKNNVMAQKAKANASMDKAERARKLQNAKKDLRPLKPNYEIALIPEVDKSNGRDDAIRARFMRLRPDDGVNGTYYFEYIAGKTGKEWLKVDEKARLIGEPAEKVYFYITDPPLVDKSAKDEKIDLTQSEQEFGKVASTQKGLRLAQQQKEEQGTKNAKAGFGAGARRFEKADSSSDSDDTSSAQKPEAEKQKSKEKQKDTDKKGKEKHLGDKSKKQSVRFSAVTATTSINTSISQSRSSAKSSLSTKSTSSSTSSTIKDSRKRGSQSSSSDSSTEAIKEPPSVYEQWPEDKVKEFYGLHKKFKAAVKGNQVTAKMFNAHMKEVPLDVRVNAQVDVKLEGRTKVPMELPRIVEKLDSTLQEAINYWKIVIDEHGHRPKMLKIVMGQSSDAFDCHGVYSLLHTEKVDPNKNRSGFPVWKMENQKVYIFSGRKGRWMIGRDEEATLKFDCDTGDFASRNRHNGAWPFEMKEWLWHDVRFDEWPVCKGMVITSVEESEEKMKRTDSEVKSANKKLKDDLARGAMPEALIRGVEKTHVAAAKKQEKKEAHAAATQFALEQRMGKADKVKEQAREHEEKLAMDYEELRTRTVIQGQEEEEQRRIEEYERVFQLVQQRQEAEKAAQEARRAGKFKWAKEDHKPKAVSKVVIMQTYSNIPQLVEDKEWEELQHRLKAAQVQNRRIKGLVETDVARKVQNFLEKRTFEELQYETLELKARLNMVTAELQVDDGLTCHNCGRHFETKKLCEEHQQTTVCRLIKKTFEGPVFSLQEHIDEFGTKLNNQLKSVKGNKRLANLDEESSDSEAEEALPFQLKLKADDKRGVEYNGIYTIQEDEDLGFENRTGMPVWKREPPEGKVQQPYWIFTNPNGRWVIGDEVEFNAKFNCTSGELKTRDANAGRWPHEMSAHGWLRFNTDTEVWQEQRGMNFSMKQPELPWLPVSYKRVHFADDVEGTGETADKKGEKGLTRKKQLKDRFEGRKQAQELGKKQEDEKREINELIEKRKYLQLKIHSFQEQRVRMEEYKYQMAREAAVAENQDALERGEKSKVDLILERQGRILDRFLFSKDELFLSVPDIPKEDVYRKRFEDIYEYNVHDMEYDDEEDENEELLALEKYFDSYKKQRRGMAETPDFISTAQGDGDSEIIDDPQPMVGQRSNFHQRSNGDYDRVDSRPLMSPTQTQRERKTRTPPPFLKQIDHQDATKIAVAHDNLGSVQGSQTLGQSRAKAVTWAEDVQGQEVDADAENNRSRSNEQRTTPLNETLLPGQEADADIGKNRSRSDDAPHNETLQLRQMILSRRQAPTWILQQPASEEFQKPKARHKQKWVMPESKSPRRPMPKPPPAEARIVSYVRDAPEMEQFRKLLERDDHGEHDLTELIEIVQAQEAEKIAKAEDKLSNKSYLRHAAIPKEVRARILYRRSRKHEKHRHPEFQAGWEAAPGTRRLN